MPDIVFDGFGILLKTAINAPLLYGAIILFVRVSGKRTTSQLNNFDWIVTVANGSLVAAGLVQAVTLLESLAGIFSLVALQHLVTWASLRSPSVEGVVKATPRLLLAHGKPLRRAMRLERVTEAELMSALRQRGVQRLEDARYVILESNASFSVFPMAASEEDGSALTNVAGMDR